VSWNVIGENAPCRGRPGGPGKKRCRAPLIVGAWFWLEGKKPFCAACALDPTQFPDDDLVARGRLLTHLRG